MAKGISFVYNDSLLAAASICQSTQGHIYLSFYSYMPKNFNGLKLKTRLLN